VAGNPSDALGGAALAVPVAQLYAEVELRPADRLSVRSHDGPPTWASAADLGREVGRVGHDGGDRLVTAAIVTLHRHLCDLGRPPEDRPFDAVWRTSIPRSVGLAGSSAVVVATMRALLELWGESLPVRDVARLALAAERDELGIAAGWMDRAVQAFDAPVLVDQRAAGDAPVPDMRVVVPGTTVELVVAWDATGASPSGRLHGGLRARLDAGDPDVGRAVDELVDTARLAADALEVGDRVSLAAAVRASCALRDRLGALDGATAALVDVAATVGAAATSAGSGGAVLVVPDERPDEVVAAFDRKGFSTAVVQLAGP
jgi:glucuronokinase